MSRYEITRIEALCDLDSAMGVGGVMPLALILTE
jgi:hypothetical protein